MHLVYMYLLNIYFLCTEKELVLEIERLKRKNGPATTVNGKKAKSATKLDAFIRSIEEERNYYKDQTEALQKMLRGEIPSRSRSPIRSRPSSRSSSPVRDIASKSDKKVTYHSSHVYKPVSQVCRLSWKGLILYLPA